MFQDSGRFHFMPTIALLLFLLESTQATMIRAVMQDNRPSGFPTRPDTN